VSRYIDQHRGRFGVEPICRILGVSASAYYQRATGQRSQRAVEDERLLERIREVHAANYYAYGYRRTWKALLRAGEPVGRDHVRRLMRANGIQGAKRRGKPWRTTIADPAARRSPDRVERNFTASRPDALWVADSPTCAAGKDCCSSASSSTSTAVGWSAGSWPATCAPISCSTRCGWRSHAANRART
jgi:putative transposase